ALGFSMFNRELPLAGLIFNRVGSVGHAEMIGEAMENLPDLHVLGYLPREKGLEIPSRHLGLITDGDFTADENRMEILARWIEGNIDLDSLLAGAGSKVEGGALASDVFRQDCTHKDSAPGVRIALARDEAVCFYYPENLRLLREAGAELIPFSPLRDPHLPEGISGLIIGGGYPELHCRALSQNRSLLDEIREFGLGGRPIYAECGGFMFLMEGISDFEGQEYPMAGIFPLAAQMEKRLHALGYREVVTRENSILGPAGTRVRGHEFHYSRIREKGRGGFPESIYDMTNRKGCSGGDEGFVRERVLGSYVHLHLGSNPGVAGHFVDYCRRYGA
ncbi:MAG: cobyrinate a,c-diamide synthase, partial [Syntrophales bacterium]|nr:cobyrinate a,c-diamide synthase [Syntrophales bacterium]